MEEESIESIVLGTIKAGIKSFDRISKVANISTDELEKTLEKLESRTLILVIEKKGFLGIKIQINITEKGEKYLENQIQELKERWREMIQLYKSEDRQNLQQYIGENKIFIKPMIFFRILDMKIFSMMFNMAELTLADYISPKDIPQDIDSE
jgi:predicted transcriptional regulator